MNGNPLKQQDSGSSTHNRQVFWQIIFPFILALLAVSLAAYWLFGNNVRGNLDIRLWADLSAILLILPVLFWILLFLIITLLIFVIFARLFEPLKNGFLKAKQITAVISKAGISICGALQKLFVEIDTITSLFHR